MGNKFLFVVLVTAMMITGMIAGMNLSLADSEADTATNLLQQVQADDDKALFLRCCWAQGRAGFHYCEEYGFCESNPEGVCKGTGAAEGRSLNCAEEMKKIHDEG